MTQRPRIAILNSSSFGKHHPDHIERLSAFAELSRVNVPPDAKAAELLDALGEVEGIIASVTPRIPREVFEALPRLLLVARHGIGCDNVDLHAATELGVFVSRVDGPVEKNAVAEMALTLMLSAARHIVPAVASVREGDWQARARYIGLELSTKTIGLIGLGNIGARLAEILRLGFRSRVLAYDPLLSREEIQARNAEPVSLDELLALSDIVSLHCPRTAETERMLDRTRIGQMKAGAFLINTCRGELLDEAALIQALDSDALGGYATDVVEGEPIAADHRLLRARNVLVLPHLGGYTQESLRGMGETMVTDCEKVFLRRLSPGVLANPEILERGARPWV